MPKRGDVDDVRVKRMHDDAPDVMRVAKPHVLPRLSAVGRLVDPITPRGALSVIGFSGANPDDVRISWIDRDIADRNRTLTVEDVLPGRAAVHGLQESA